MKHIQSEKLRKILIISRDKNQISKALETFKERFPQGELFVLAQAQEESLKTNPAISGIITFTEYGKFSILKTKLSFLKRLRKERFDGIIILYSNLLEDDYFDIELFAFLSKAKYGIIYVIREQIYSLTFKFWLIKLLRGLLTPLVFLLVYFKIKIKLIKGV